MRNGDRWVIRPVQQPLRQEIVSCAGIAPRPATHFDLTIGLSEPLICDVYEGAIKEGG